MRIAKQLLDEIVDHARTEAPDECCGVVGSRDDAAVRVYPAHNSAPSPPLGYEIDGKELLGIYREIEDHGLDLGAIYHSHTRSEPVPSQTDINLAFYPDTIYVIVGLAGDEPDVRAFTIRDGDVADAILSIE